MDPNETLNKLRALVREVAYEEQTDNEFALDLANHFEALDGWISRGGFLPAQWQKAQKEEK